MNELGPKLAGLFMASGKAHHKAYEATDGFDPEWPLFYADYLIEDINVLLNASLTKSELIYLLVRLSHEQPLDAPGVKWPKYYAKFLLQRYRFGED